MRIWGPLCILLGIISLVAAFMIDTAPLGTHNLGRLQSQMMALHFGLGMLLVGSVLAGASAIVDQLRYGASVSSGSGYVREDAPRSTLSDEAHRKRIIWTAVGLGALVLAVIWLAGTN